jgi:glyoxylase I family protein
MAKILGIGGVFIYADHTGLLAEWYTRYLGFNFEHMAEEETSPTFYQVLESREADDAEKKVYTVFAIMPSQLELSQPRNQAMVNFRVDDLDALAKQLSDAGISVEPVEIWADGQGDGKFTHLRDPEGNRIELWQHIER